MENKFYEIFYKVTHLKYAFNNVIYDIGSKINGFFIIL